MLLEELVLYNFGIYKGKHAINLLPNKPNKPVILFGALNGGGKTTFLDALQLVLYGKLAKCSNRGNLSYHDYLKETINHHADVSQGASIELQFSHKRDGNNHVIRVIRAWHWTGKGIKESVEVFKDGALDPVTTDRWYEYVDEFIPSSISSLFFFDGEEINRFASDDKAPELIKTGLHALLGLDLVDRLSKDLIHIENKRKIELKDDTEKGKINDLEQRIQGIEERKTELTQKLGDIQNEIDKTHRQLEKDQNEYRAHGGELYEKRDTYKAERTITEQRLKDAEQQLHELASGEAPLLLVRDLLNSSKAQASREKKATIFKELRETLAERDNDILKQLKSNNTDNSLIKELDKLLKNDIRNREKALDFHSYINIDVTHLNTISDEALDHLQETIKNKLIHTKTIADQLEDIDRNMASMPDPESLEGINEKINNAENSLNQALIKQEVLKMEHYTLNKELSSRRDEYYRYMEIQTDKKFIDETNHRVLDQSSKLKSTLSEFRRRVSEKHISKLESLILESFQNLIRKPDLVTSITISPDTYEFKLYNKQGEHIPSKRLSAGERQLLAISILWALAKASDRPLPSVIDTPLGRLDGSHRSHLVNNYFPNASHQVLLLSTDEEIDGNYYKDLKKSIGLEYLIEYDEVNATASVTSGYFF